MTLAEVIPLVRDEDTQTITEQARRIAELEYSLRRVARALRLRPDAGPDRMVAAIRRWSR